MNFWQVVLGLPSAFAVSGSLNVGWTVVLDRFIITLCALCKRSLS